MLKRCSVFLGAMRCDIVIYTVADKKETGWRNPAGSCIKKTTR